MKPVATALGAAVLSALAFGAAAQTIVPGQSTISFTTRQMGVPVDGKFAKWAAQIEFDPKKPEAGHVGFSIDTGSATFGSAEVDAEVPKAVWFNVAKFPQATFQSGAIKATGPGRYDVAGKLTLKGSVRDVVVPVTVVQAGGTSTASGSFTIRRLEFKVGEGEWADTSMVADDVTVKFRLTLTGMGPL